MINTNKQLTQQPLSVQNILQLSQEQVQYLYGNNLKQIILFGSYARGNFTSDSDIDILIVTQKKLSKPEREQLINFISDVSINDDILINFIIDISENCQTLTMNAFWQAIAKRCCKQFANCKYPHVLH